MRPVRIKHTIDRLASHGGLVLIGELLNSMKLDNQLDQLKVHCIDPKFSHTDIVYAMTALISIAKPDYDAIEIFREKQDFFTKALRISGCPSSPTLRQRIDLIGHAADAILKNACADLIRSKAPAVSPIETAAGQFVTLDIDVSPFDNSKTKKEGVSRTYKGYDGYAPIFAYLGVEGYLVNLELRQGSQHCQKNTPQFIDQTLALVHEITKQPILMRLDSGNDSQDNFPDDQWQDVQFIIKRNLRRESSQKWAELAREKGHAMIRRPDKTVWTGKTRIGVNGETLPFPIVFEVTEHHIKKGQQLMFPEIDIDTYWCSIEALDASEVISLYHDHGTSEQYHSEIKSDMDLERLPSCFFASNSLILHLGMLTYNMLRVIGQISLDEMGKGPFPGFRRKGVKRRRIKTVIQDLMYMAGRLIHTGRRWYISFGQLNPFAAICERINNRIRGGPVLAS
jgi:hypothetical protein